MWPWCPRYLRPPTGSRMTPREPPRSTALEVECQASMTTGMIIG
ncbi:hypothetical protein ACFPRL_06080 [Pseudoclavibacter helvolus]